MPSFQSRLKSYFSIFIELSANLLVVALLISAFEAIRWVLRLMVGDDAKLFGGPDFLTVTLYIGDAFSLALMATFLVRTIVSVWKVMIRGEHSSND